ncbi:hypothetical protein BST11_24160 [Mycobacterium alsense]|uniref:PE domain-containing protein n=1 Tax=Mycobacterium alsense TaxID=324058 RepID=A0AA41XRK4_9MYCO|nr:PE domain-containing protein [Mycobacterium alsense]MCV7380177.1 PE domain-containing protein [Mycobacterium alsense]OQZ88184.1 hypothetical protein BST11_24160 [Mycobacterium alsense]
MSSFVLVLPDAAAAAAHDLTDIGLTLQSATAAAADSTTSVAVAAQDEVSAAIAGRARSKAENTTAAWTSPLRPEHMAASAA